MLPASELAALQNSVMLPTLTDSANVYFPPDPNTATREARGGLRQHFPDGWSSIIGGVSIAAGHAGSGYSANDVVTLVGGDSLATVKIKTVNGNGAALTIELVTLGSGYQMKSNTITGGAGAGLKITVTPKTFPCFVAEGTRPTEQAGAGQVQASAGGFKPPTISFPLDAILNETARVKIIASLYNPVLVGRVYDVQGQPPESSLQLVRMMNATMIRPTAANP